MTSRTLPSRICTLPTVPSRFWTLASVHCSSLQDSSDCCFLESGPVSLHPSLTSHGFEIVHRASLHCTQLSCCCSAAHYTAAYYCLTSGICESDTISEWKYGPRVSTAFAVWPLCAAPTFRLGHCEQIYTCSCLIPCGENFTGVFGLFKARYFTAG